MFIGFLPRLFVWCVWAGWSSFCIVWSNRVVRQRMSGPWRYNWTLEKQHLLSYVWKIHIPQPQTLTKTADINGLHYFSYCQIEWSLWLVLKHILPLQLWNAHPTVILSHVPQFANLPVTQFHQISALGLVLKDVFVTLDTSSVLASAWKKTHVAAGIMDIIIRWGNCMWNHLGQWWFVIVNQVVFFIKLTYFFSAWI